ncbi:putative bifunctional chitinase/lysozyme [Orchesella cincta]|uniref:Putative bifunctional chitinase/lysozyme n=1 Tax=Orchesella cincta TaxID=48709 RepID=A0A1D2MMI2_ORCCI|nr:putative bifunctional chitinase/lysozyme [Orchesella cincta]
MNSLAKTALFLLVCGTPIFCNAAGNVRFAPYYDTFLDNRKNLADIARTTGQLNYHLAFALGGHQGCKPMWGGTFEIDDETILNPIKEVKAMGGEMIIATGGALGPYLEHLCTTVDDLATAYKTALDAVGTNHLDVDVETTVNFDLMNQALAKVQQERPDVTVSFTLMIQGEDYGLTPALGVDLLVNAKRNGVRVDIVNAMTMEFPKQSPDFGDAVINAAIMVLAQMKEIWPEKSDAELKQMIGVTPMIGRNFNGNVFEVTHARKLVDWANTNRIGLLAFWSIERDNGGCPGSVSPYCSGASSQTDYEFTQVFKGFNY